MIDVKILRAFPEKVKDAVNVRKVKGVDVDEILELDKARLEMLQHVESHRALKNALGEKIAVAKDGKEREKLLAEATTLKEELKKFEDDLKILEGKLEDQMLHLPNFPCVDMPIGDGEADNIELAVWMPETGYLPKDKLGKGFDAAKYMPKATFAMQDHVTLGKKLDIIDIEQSAKTSGSRFCYLKNEAVLLQDALASHLKKKLMSEGFVPIVPPILVRDRVLVGTSHFPEGRDQVYKIDSEFVEENTQLYLVGSSEPPLFAYHMDKVLDKHQLPYKMFALTTCFRSEVGSWGKDVYGIKRVHQFDKLEMDVVSAPEDSKVTMEYMREINEWFMQELKLPYRVINKCTGDAGYLATHKQYDVEVWLPSQQEFVEMGSNTNATDFQARRLNIKYKDGKDLRYVHTVNDTGIPMGRMILAIIDNYQKEDGTVEIPQVLVPYIGKDVISK